MEAITEQHIIGQAAVPSVINIWATFIKNFNIKTSYQFPFPRFRVRIVTCLVGRRRC
jgi:hypothetical protein